MKAVVICGGTIIDINYYQFYLKQADCIICADRGVQYLEGTGCQPDLLIGDFDSIDKDILKAYKELDREILKFPSEKDATDSELAIEEAIKRGAKTVYLLGAQGSRLDHTLCNILLLRKFSQNGVEIIMVNENNVIYVLTDTIKLKRTLHNKISLIPITEKVKGVTTNGLKYQLDNKDMIMYSSYGISNEFIDEYAEISIKEGAMLVVLSND